MNNPDIDQIDGTLAINILSRSHRLWRIGRRTTATAPVTKPAASARRACPTGGQPSGSMAGGLGGRRMPAVTWPLPECR